MQTNISVCIACSNNGLSIHQNETRHLNLNKTIIENLKEANKQYRFYEIKNKGQHTVFALFHSNLNKQRCLFVFESDFLTNYCKIHTNKKN